MLLGMCTTINEVSTHGRWWGVLGLGRDTLNDSSIVADNMIMMPLWQSGIVGHAVIAHVNILLVLWLSLVFDRWGKFYPVLVWLMTSSIRRWKLKTTQAYSMGHREYQWGNIMMPITDHCVLQFTNMTMRLTQ